MSQHSVQIKKVKAYPIAVQFKTATAVLPGQIVKLTQNGFLAEVGATSLQPGEKFECTFELPVMHHLVTEPVVMIKFYTQWAGKSQTPNPATSAPHAEVGATGHGVLHLIEAHFTSLGETNHLKITSFLQTIQKPSQ